MFPLKRPAESQVSAFKILGHALAASQSLGVGTLA